MHSFLVVRCVRRAPFQRVSSGHTLMDTSHSWTLLTWSPRSAEVSFQRVSSSHTLMDTSHSWTLLTWTLRSAEVSRSRAEAQDPRPVTCLGFWSRFLHFNHQKPMDFGQNQNLENLGKKPGVVARKVSWCIA